MRCMCSLESTFLSYSFLLGGFSIDFGILESKTSHTEDVSVDSLTIDSSIDHGDEHDYLGLPLNFGEYFCASCCYSNSLS